MIFSTNKKVGPTVGLDLDTGSVAATEVGTDSLRFGVQAVPPGAFKDGEVLDAEAMAGALKELFAQRGLSKRVRLAVANQGVAFRTLRLPLIDDPEQLKSAVRFQAQEQIPMPLDSAVLDHQVIGGSVTEDGNRQVDVAVVAARKETVESLLEPVRAAGLEPVGVDFAAFGMIRALAGGASSPAPASDGGGQAATEEFVPATLYCSLGDLTNLAIARGFACMFSRVAQFGVRQIAEELSSSTDLPMEHAEQWLLHVGFETPLDQLEGDAGAAAAARVALEGGAAKLADELRLSLDYFASQQEATPVGDIVLCGWGSAIPGLASRLTTELGRTVTFRRPAALSGLEATEAARLTLPYGLALER